MDEKNDVRRLPEELAPGPDGAPAPDEATAGPARLPSGVGRMPVRRRWPLVRRRP